MQGVYDAREAGKKTWREIIQPRIDTIRKSTGDELKKAIWDFYLVWTEFNDADKWVR